MKKIITAVVVIVLIAYIIVQNGGRMFLIFLSQHRLSNPFQSTSSTIATNNKPVKYKDGAYTGTVADAFYGNIQVKAIIQNEKISDVQFLQYPNEAVRSVAINEIAMPNLKQEAIQSQNAHVDIVTGATQTSQAFIQSLQAALDQAKS